MDLKIMVENMEDKTKSMVESVHARCMSVYNLQSVARLEKKKKRRKILVPYLQHLLYQWLYQYRNPEKDDICRRLGQCLHCGRGVWLEGSQEVTWKLLTDCDDPTEKSCNYTYGSGNLLSETNGKSLLTGEQAEIRTASLKKGLDFHLWAPKKSSCRVLKGYSTVYY